MFVRAPIGKQDRVMASILAILSDGQELQHLPSYEEGCYDNAGFNFSNYIAGGLTFDQKYPDLSEYHEDLCSYGVVDSIEQFRKLFEPLHRDAYRKFAVGFTLVTKESQPSDGGWRWHKWGPYLGEKNPEYEYLADEGPEIEQVYCFEIIELNRPEVGQ